MKLSDLDAFIVTRLAASQTQPSRVLHINNAYLELSRIFTVDVSESDDSLSSTMGEARMELPFRPRRIRGVRVLDEGGWQLRRVYRDAVMFPPAEGKPKRWASDLGDAVSAILLDPSPDDTYSLEVLYEPNPVPLEDLADEPQYIPEDYHYLIAYGALSLAAASQEDWGIAQYWGSAYQAGVNEMLEHLGLNAPDDFPGMLTQALGGGRGS